MVSCRYAKIQDVIIEEKICKHFTFMFSPLSNMKASDKPWKSSLRDVFKADVVCYDKTISTTFPIIKRKRLTLMLSVCFVIRKLSVKLMRRSFCFLYIYLKVTKVYGIKLTISVYYRILLSRFQSFCMSSEFASILYQGPSNYRPNNDMFISPANVDE